MNGIKLKDTIAYKIINQIIDHVLPLDSSNLDLDINDFQNIIDSFGNTGGSWFELINGNLDHVVILEKKIVEYIDDRKLDGIARRLSVSL